MNWMNIVEWTNPFSVNLEKGVGMLYFIKIIEPISNMEYRYIGQTKHGKRRLREYRNNVRRIFKGQPRRTTPGQENYRPVHLALAKACEFGWEYEFYPLENVEMRHLNDLEQCRSVELQCGLNTKWSWAVEDYPRLTVEMIK